MRPRSRRAISLAAVFGAGVSMPMSMSVCVRVFARVITGMFSLAVAAGTVWAQPAAASPNGVSVLRQAERSNADGTTTPVTLPDEGELRPGEQGPLQYRYRWNLTLTEPLHGYALYLPGLIAHAVVSVNGQVLADASARNGQPLPRSVDRLVLIDVPDVFWQDGKNTIDLQAIGTLRMSVSALQLGPAAELAARYRARVLALAVLPAMVAAVVAALGLCMLLIWSRQREPLYGYFGASALAWALHSAWTVSPWAVLGGGHFGVWWTSLYGLFIALLVIFSLRLADSHWPRFERVLWVAVVAGPALLYLALALDHYASASDALRMAWIGAVGVAVLVVAGVAWRRRDADSVLITLTGLVSLIFGLHDWWVSLDPDDNNPIFLVPYAGLLFVVVVVRMLVDRFVRASRNLAALNTELERRVAAQRSELLVTLEHMRQARDAAETADRAKSNFLATASHDLRQPAHALGLYLAALRAEPLGETQAELVQRMTGSLAALDTMFNALLDISRMDGGAVVPQPGVFALDPLLRRLAEEFAPQAEARGLRLALRLPPSHVQPRASSDAVLIERIVRNLLANAVKYTVRGGVLLACRLRQTPTPHWRIEVWDTGVGIGDADRGRVFEEFYQVGNEERDLSQGLGLGLAIVRRLTRLLGLTLELHSRSGRGSCFVLPLPAAQGGAATPPANAPASTTVPTLADTTVAIIEDNADVRNAMRTLLRVWGCRVIEGADAAEVLQRLHGQGPPQAIVADFRLSAGRNGPGEVQHLLAHWGATLPVLIVSGETSPAHLRAIEAAGHAWLAKPVAAGPLRQWLEQAVLHGPQTGARP